MIATAMLLGLGGEFAPIDPIKALFWSAVINGFVAVPIMIGMMTVVGRHAQMKQFTARPALLATGWGATGVMMLAAGTMLVFR